MKIAIMGGSSHIAGNLAMRFAADPGAELALFCRSRGPVEEFVRRFCAGGQVEIFDSYRNFADHHFDAVIDCVGAGAPGTPDFSPRNWFDTVQRFDDMAVEYLEKCNPEAVLITFSSGAIYGTRTPGPFSGTSCCEIPVNALEVSDYYTISRLYAEAKHRARRDLRIVDLRIFSFFSRFIRVDAGYFMSDVLKALLDREPMVTSPQDMVRDYVAPDDLFDAVRFCIGMGKVNGAFDVRSAGPVSKYRILERFGKEFGLRWSFADVPVSPNGAKPVYCSTDTALEEAGFRARLTAEDGLVCETEKRLAEME